MATVINRTTTKIIYSANTPDYPITDWIINPDLSLLTSVPQKYWKISGDSVLEMSAQEKINADAVIAANTFPDNFETSLGDTASTNSSSYINRLTFNINLQAGQEYEITSNFTWSFSSTSFYFKSRLTYFKDDLNTLWQISVTPTSSSDVIPFSNITTFSVLTSGVYTINLDYASSNPSRTATVYGTAIKLRST